MIEAVLGKPDWFYVDSDTIKPIQNLPGAQVKSSGRVARPIIHRSLLPLLETDEAENTRAILTYGTQDNAARDRWAMDRGIKLRPTQHSGLQFIDPRRGVLVGDEMRLGKTLTAIAAHDPARGQLIIIAPLPTRGVWLGWARRCFPDLPIGVCIGKTFDKTEFDKPIVFGHYDIIGEWLSVRRSGTLIFDEAHLLTNRKTKRVTAAVMLQSRAEKVIALTGTPIWNMPPNLWAVLGLIAPGAWGNFYDFSNRYGLPVETGYGAKYTGASNETELRSRLEEVMIRRLWKDAAKDLPPITRTVSVAEVSDSERRKLDIIAGELRANKTRASTAGNLATYRRSVAAIKAKLAVQKANKLLDAGEPVVLWTWHKDLAERLVADLGERALLVHGEVPAAVRDVRMDGWRSSATPLALVITLAVGQVGIDLSHAPSEIFVEVDWTPAVIAQAEMRIFKAGQPMFVDFIVANHLVDQRLVRSLVTKLGAADAFGVGSACDAIDALRDAVLGPRDDGDLDRLLEDLIGSNE